MKVWELIEKLADVDKDAEVVFASDNSPTSGCLVAVDNIKPAKLSWQRSIYVPEKSVGCLRDVEAPNTGRVYRTILERPAVLVVEVTGTEWLDQKIAEEEGYTVRKG